MTEDKRGPNCWGSNNIVAGIVTLHEAETTCNREAHLESELDRIHGALCSRLGAKHRFISPFEQQDRIPIANITNGDEFKEQGYDKGSHHEESGREEI